MSSRTSGGFNPVTAFMALMGVGVLALLVWLWGAQFGHFAWSLLRSASMPILIGVFVVAAVVVVSAIMYDVWHAAVIPALVLGAIGFGLTAWIVNGYVIPHQLAEKTQIESAEGLDFRQRVPYDVAVATSNRNLGATTGDATGSIKALPAEGDYGVYTTTVERRGLFKGYESTQTMTAPLYGSTSAQNVEFCEFSEAAGMKLSGMSPGNDLARAIMWKTSPSTKVDKEDALVRCEDGTPMVYVPLTKLDGSLFFPQRVPGGTAVYNGETGELTIEDEIDTDLPLYPKSIAENQREALTKSGTFLDWIFSRSGYEDTSKDENDPNGENRAEFGLASADGNTQYYATPLTTRGSSSSIIALGTIESDGEIKSGELHTYTVNEYEQALQANSSIADRITGEVLGGYRANGLTVFEVTPSEEGTWTATVGKEQTVLYRAIIHQDGTIELLDAKGNSVAGDDPENPEEGGIEVDIDKPLEDMTTEELKELGDQVLEELASRSQVE